MDERQILNHQISNLLQSLLLFGGMVGLLTVIAWIIAGPGAIVWTLGLGVVLFALGPQASPRLILRFYGARPVAPHEAPEIHELIAALAAHSGLDHTPRLFYVPSRTLNAFTLGHRDDAAVVVTDGLLRRLDSRELAGVLAHEMSHVAHNDMWIMGLADSMSRLTRTLSLLGIMLLFINLPLFLLGAAHLPWLAIPLLIASPTLSALLQLALSRNREFVADLGAAQLTGDPMGLAGALDKLERYQGRMWEQILMPGLRLPEPSLLRTHPPTEERVRRLMELAPRPAFERPLPGLPAGAWPADWPVVLHAPRWHWRAGVWR
ncbi:MAG: zinc metalloprotease HtpX [Alphaproteobacteria bacterium]